MSVRIEKDGPVWTVIHSRPEVRNAMDPDSAEALYNAFRTFDQDETANVAVFWGEGGVFCAGWDLKHAASLSGAHALNPFDFPDEGEPPMAAMGPSRLELSKPVIAAVAGPAVAGGMELALWCEQFSPLVGLEPECEPSCLLLDVTGLATLFGGEMALAERVVAQFRQRGYQVRCAIADTVGTAWATARFGRYLDSTTVDTTAGDFPLRLVQPDAGLGPLGPLPLAALRLDDSTRELLHRLGIRCVRQLAALPRAELTSRLGDQVVLTWFRGLHRIPYLARLAGHN